MKYRVRLDLSFNNKKIADLLMNYVKDRANSAVSINEGEVNEEISFVEYHLCGHDEGLPCGDVERIEVRRK